MICDSDSWFCSQSSSEYWRCKVWTGVNGPACGDVGLEYPEDPDDADDVEGIEAEDMDDGDMRSREVRSMGSGMVSG